jgi:hypothetical protein
MSERCDGCGKMVDEVCGGMYCRACHKSLTFEDCINDVSANRLRAQYGLPPMESGQVRGPDK